MSPIKAQLEGRNGSRKAMNVPAVSGWWMSTGINLRSSVAIEGMRGVPMALPEVT